MPIELPTELLYVLIFFLIVAAIVLFFVFSAFSKQNIENFWTNLKNFLEKAFSKK